MEGNRDKEIHWRIDRLGSWRWEREKEENIPKCSTLASICWPPLPLCLNPPNPCLHASRCVQANGRTPDLKSAWRTCFRWPIPTARGRERKKHSTPPSTAVTTWRADLPLKFLVTNQIKIVASGECKTTGLPAIYFCFLRVRQPRVCVPGDRCERN